MFRGFVLATFAALVLGGLSAELGADDTCVYSFSKGTGGDHISWCVSSGGNIVRFRAHGADYIGTVGAFQEGFTFCQFPGGQRLAYDDGIDQSGWSGQGPTLVSLVPLTIDRTIVNPATSQPILRFRQKFTTDYSEKELLVDMTLTNISAADISFLTFKRISNLHPGGQLNNPWNHGVGGIWVGDQSGAVTMSSVLRSTSSSEAYLTGYSEVARCFEERVAAPIEGDLIGTINFSVGTLRAGRGKTFRVTYRAM